ncbi:MAG: translocation/assembly module TamB domain-containing protein, partial [Bacteriovoracaceae bacterium]|nr:translocation/assembly module TamB domain-containing protein [Bacteriovoracaceae bacterium]
KSWADIHPGWAKFPSEIKFDGAVQGTKNALQVNHFQIVTATTEIGLTGQAFARNKQLHTQGRFDFRGEVAAWPRGWWPQHELVAHQTAQGQLSLSWQGVDKDITAQGALDFQEVKLADATLDRVQLGFRLKDAKLGLTRADLALGSGSLIYTGETDFFSLKTKSLLPFKFTWELKRFAMEKAFAFLGDQLTFIEGKVSGKLDVQVDLAQDKVFFVLHKDYLVEDFALQDQKNKRKIIGQPRFVGQESTVDLYHGQDVFLDLNFAAPDFTINLNGTVINRDSKIKISSPLLNLKSFGPIAGVPMTGEGPVVVTVIDEKFTTVEVLAQQIKDYSVQGFNLGPMSGKILIDVDHDYLILQDINGAVGNSAYLANGRIGWATDLDFDLAIQTRNMSFQESLNVYAPLIQEIKDYLPSHLEFFYQADYQIKGNPLKNFQVNGQLQGQNLRYYQEMANNLSVDFSFENNVLRFSNFVLNKNPGQIKGSYTFDLKSDYHELDLRMANFLLSDFNYYQMLNLGLYGTLHGDWYLSGTRKDYSGRGKLNLVDSQVGLMKLPDSHLSVYVNNKEISFSADGMAQRFVAAGRLWEGRDKISRVSFKSNFEDLKLPLGILAQQNLQKEDLGGLLQGSGELVFKGDNFLLQEISLNLDAFDFHYEDLAVHRHPTWHKLHLKAQEKNEDNQILLLGKGVDVAFKNQRNTKTARLLVQYDLDAKLLELLGPMLSSAKGQVQGELELGLQQKLDHELKINGRDISLKFIHWPMPIEKLNFVARLHRDQINIPSLSLTTGRGRVRGKGRVVFFPELSPQMQFTIDKVAISFFKKSYITLSGNVQIDEGQPPYVIKGKLIAENGEILDDLSALQNTQSNEDYQQYLPNHHDDKLVQQFIYQLQLENRQPISFKNNFFDMQLRASGRLLGPLMYPILEGEVAIVPDVSKFVFKGHEFKGHEGKVTFHGDARRDSKDIRFVGDSKINEYDVHLEVGGTTDKIDAQLTSRPALGQEDLLNLITFGVTPEISKNLNAAGRDSVASLGVGSLVMDQLQLGQGLRSALGVSVSVAPEFMDNESSLLPSESNNTNRVNTATKIKMQKQIHQNMDVSVSSIIGGSSAQQKQSLNLDYNLNKNISVQGVYEIKSNNNELNQNENTNSSGVDLKWRWSFK